MLLDRIQPTGRKDFAYFPNAIAAAEDVSNSDRTSFLLYLLPQKYIFPIVRIAYVH